MGAPDFSKIKDLNTWANLCKDVFYLATIKNDNRAVAIGKQFVQRKQNQHLHQFKKVRHRGIKDSLNCDLMFLFIIPMKLKTFRITQNDTPEMVKMYVSTNKWLHFFA